jgi:hypothetical protein
METLTIRLQKTPFGLLRVSVLETDQVVYLPYEFLEEASRLVTLPPTAAVADVGTTAVEAACYRDRDGEVVELRLVRHLPPAAAVVAHVA